MKFRPCIDIHNGKVKQIVGASLRDAGDFAEENFSSDRPARWFADYFEGFGLSGGHVILLNGKDSAYYQETKREALSVLQAYPGKWQLGGGVTLENAEEYLSVGASHVIVTSYIFHDGRVDEERLSGLVGRIGPERLVLDVSCKRRGERYFLVTDRWQVMTEIEVGSALLERLSPFCGEFLIHAADAEGKRKGIEETLARRLGSFAGRPVTYAGGISAKADIERLRELGEGRLDYTVGSALSVFGGGLELKEILD
ncbi:MAG: phosphoribosylformimino-5-aminoimidazole carboxamide ribotide isomerase [Lachnospiraceae bacterium]|nr:phosphoribosylformimino-5-aminoimidazole carboxamide ribotide isomerase [Lachnospiraceae bacterium]